jgi:hypothetical protein
MGHGGHNDVHLFMCGRIHGAAIYFPRRRFISVTTTRMIWPWDWEDKKVRGLKHFEARIAQGKEYQSTGHWSLVTINLIGVVIRPNKKVQYCSRRTLSDRHMVRIAWSVSSSGRRLIRSQRYIARSVLVQTDEDITTSDTTTLSIEVQGPITRSRAQQLRR